MSRIARIVSVAHGPLVRRERGARHAARRAARRRDRPPRIAGCLRLIVHGLPLGLVLLTLACSAKRPPTPIWPEGGLTPERFMATLAGEPAGTTYRARLFLVFEGGYLDEDEIKINGQMALAGPDRLRMIGAYGAFKKVFDLVVVGDRFQVYDHRENVLYRGGAFDADAARKLGLALRPGDLVRLLTVGGTGPLAEAEIEAIEPSADSLRVLFGLPGDPAGYEAGYRNDPWRLSSLTRDDDGHIGFRVSYDRYFRSGDHWVPGRVEVARLSGDQRAEIEVRSIRFEDALSDDLFDFEIPEDAEIVDL